MFAAKGRPPQDAAVSSRPGTLACPARTSGNLRQESQKRPFVFSDLRTLPPAQKFQRPYFHSLPHSLQQEQKLTNVFSVTSEQFLRSSAQERKSTPLFSCACALFGKATGEGVGVAFSSFPGCGLYLEPAKKRVWAVLAAHANRGWAVLAAHANRGWAVLAAHANRGWAVLAANSNRMNTYAECVTNPCRMCT